MRECVSAYEGECVSDTVAVRSSYVVVAWTLFAIFLFAAIVAPFEPFVFLLVRCSPGHGACGCGDCGVETAPSSCWHPGIVSSLCSFVPTSMQCWLEKL